MSLQITTHLNFRGTARAALEFYQSVFGGELAIVTYANAHKVQAPHEAEQVMWGQVLAKNGFRIMAYDAPSSVPFDAGKAPFFVSVKSESSKELTTIWEKLSAEGVVLQPLGRSDWAELFGMVTDRFGVTWVVDLTAPERV